MTALACLVVLLSSGSALAASPRFLSFVLIGYQARAPIKLQVSIQVPGRPSIVRTCPPRCTVAFGPGTRIPSPVRYHIVDETIGSHEFGSYVSATGAPYQVVDYGTCQHPQLADKLSTSCSGTASRTSTVAVRLEYRPLVTLVATGSIEDIRPTYYTGVTMDAQVTNGSSLDGGSADCMFKIEAVTGERCSYRLDQGPVTVSTSDGGYLYGFGGYASGPCSGQEVGAPYQHRCLFTLGESDVTVHATVKPPPNATAVAALASGQPPPTAPQTKFGPFLSDFQANSGEALDRVLNDLLDLYYGKGQAAFLIEVSLLNLSGLTVNGFGPGGPGAHAVGAAARLILSGRPRAADDEIAPLVVKLTRAGRKLFARAGRHRITITATYVPPSGPALSRTRSGRVRS